MPENAIAGRTYQPDKTAIDENTHTIAICCFVRAPHCRLYENGAFGYDPVLEVTQSRPLTRSDRYWAIAQTRYAILDPTSMGVLFLSWSIDMLAMEGTRST